MGRLNAIKNTRRHGTGRKKRSVGRRSTDGRRKQRFSSWRWICVPGGKPALADTGGVSPASASSRELPESGRNPSLRSRRRMPSPAGATAKVLSISRRMSRTRCGTTPSRSGAGSASTQPRTTGNCSSSRKRAPSAVRTIPKTFGTLPPSTPPWRATDACRNRRRHRKTRVLRRVLPRTRKDPKRYPGAIALRSLCGKGSGDPGRIRTCGLRIRNPPLYPTELRGRDATIARRGGCAIVAHAGARPAPLEGNAAGRCVARSSWGGQPKCNFSASYPAPRLRSP